MENTLEKLKIDIGCGSNKKKGYLGVDYQKFDNVDYVLDATKEPLPFKDRSVENIFSAHFFEHILVPNFIWSEISRVAVNGAELEVWTPYAFHNDAFCYGHKIFFTEEHWLHICMRYPDFYYPIINARWILKKIVYVVDKPAYDEIIRKGFVIEFAIKYFKGVVRELGAFIEIYHDSINRECNPQKYYSFERGGENIILE
jgi:hypothetical protein